MSQPKTITLKSSDGQIFEVDQLVAAKSLTIKHIIEDVPEVTPITISNVTGKILAKVIDYCKMHADSDSKTPSADIESLTMAFNPKITPDDGNESPIMAFDREFVNIDQSTLFDLILAADYLNIKSLLDLCGDAMEEIMEVFHIKNDFTPEELAMIRKESDEWSFMKSNSFLQRIKYLGFDN